MKSRMAFIQARSITVFLLACLCLFCEARAETTLKVLDTYPAIQSTTLPIHQNFYVRVAYSTDKPVWIWVRPYFRGQQANAASHPSREYMGNGEVLGWFFFNKSGHQVDEIRITAEEHRGAIASITYPVNIIGDNSSKTSEAPPTWVTKLSARDAAAEEKARQVRMSKPTDFSISLLFFSSISLLFFSLLILVIIGGFVAPIWMFIRWSGGWRIAPALLITLMGLVLLNILIGVSLDPTSHNLFPFEIAMAGLFNSVITTVLLLVRKLSRAKV